MVASFTSASPSSTVPSTGRLAPVRTCRQSPRRTSSRPICTSVPSGRTTHTVSARTSRLSSKAMRVRAFTWSCMSSETCSKNMILPADVNSRWTMAVVIATASSTSTVTLPESNACRPRTKCESRFCKRNRRCQRRGQQTAFDKANSHHSGKLNCKPVVLECHIRFGIAGDSRQVAGIERADGAKHACAHGVSGSVFHQNAPIGRVYFCIRHAAYSPQVRGNAVALIPRRTDGIRSAPGGGPVCPA